MSPGWAWLAAAAALAAAELAVPGVFLIWLAAAAAVAGAAALATGLPAAGQFAVFAASAVASLYLGRAAYRRGALPADPLLNDGAARLIGRRVTVVEAITDGEGRALVGDSAWIARGSDMPAGARALIVDVEGNALTVVAVDRIADGPARRPAAPG